MNFKRVLLFATGVVAVTLGGDVAAIALGGDASRALRPEAWWPHAKFLVTFIGLVVLGGAAGLEVDRRRRLRGGAIAAAGGAAAVICYLAGLASAEPFGLTVSLLFMVAVAAGVVSMAATIAAAWQNKGQ